MENDDNDKKDKNLPIVSEAEFKKDAGPGRPHKPSRKRQSVREMVEELGGNPVKLCVDLVKGDHTALGFDQAKTIITDKDGNPVSEKPNLTVEIRFQAAKTLLDFMFSKKHSISGDDDGPPLEFKGQLGVDITTLVNMVKRAKGDK
jgi:hypothetical protein